jgi:hypothetical protein
MLNALTIDVERAITGLKCGSGSALLEPGEIGLLPAEEATDRIDQDMIGRHRAQTTGLFE